MGKSARVLGWEFGRTAREMNELFNQYGYLEGDPGAYRITEKGQQYAEEQYHFRGTGGYAHYNPHWETRTWNAETAAALRADMESNPGGVVVEHALVEEDDNDDPFEYEPPLDYNASDNDGSQFGWKDMVIAGAIVGAILIAPRVKPFYDNKVNPAARKLRDKLMKWEPVQAETLGTTEIQEQRGG